MVRASRSTRYSPKVSGDGAQGIRLGHPAQFSQLPLGLVVALLDRPPRPLCPGQVGPVDAVDITIARCQFFPQRVGRVDPLSGRRRRIRSGVLDLVEFGSGEVVGRGIVFVRVGVGVGLRRDMGHGNVVALARRRRVHGCREDRGSEWWW
jgi:hypothetical protein